MEIFADNGLTDIVSSLDIIVINITISSINTEWVVSPNTRKHQIVKKKYFILKLFIYL